MKRFENKTFDTSTEEGIKQAEQYQSKLYSKYESVTVKPIGMFRVIVIGHNGRI